MKKIFGKIIHGLATGIGSFFNVLINNERNCRNLWRDKTIAFDVIYCRMFNYFYISDNPLTFAKRSYVFYICGNFYTNSWTEIYISIKIC